MTCGGVCPTDVSRELRPCFGPVKSRGARGGSSRSASGPLDRNGLEEGARDQRADPSIETGSRRELAISERTPRSKRARGGSSRSASGPLDRNGLEEGARDQR